MFKGRLFGEKVILDDGKSLELYKNNWYGNIENGKLILSLIEACFLVERGKLEIFNGNKKISFEEFYEYCTNKVENFLTKYNVYKDLRDRGLPVREGFKGCDFRVYERGVKPGKEKPVKWVIFVDSEDFECNFNKIGKAIKISNNIRAVALWAVLDNDLDCTYYIINEIEP